MKNILSAANLFLIFIGIPAFSQTLELEYENMMSKYLSKDYSQTEFRDITFTWRDMIDSIGYPSVPYDSVSKKVEYEYLHTLEGISRESIVNRVSEWAAVSFGSTDGLRTQQDTTTRLILNRAIEVFFPDLSMVYKNSWRGYVEAELQNSSICFFTMVFTIKDGKMRTQLVNISYEYTDFLIDRNISKTLNSYFPISNNEQKEWKAILHLVNETTISFQTMIDLMLSYILDYENDYHW